MIIISSFICNLIQNKGIISLILYNHHKLTLTTFNEIIRNKAGNMYKMKGYKRLSIKLEIESFIKAF